MKKNLLTLFLTFSPVFVFSQTISYGIKAGLNLSDQSVKSPFYGLSNDNILIGFHIGGTIALSFSDFAIQSGILYSTKGAKMPEQITKVYNTSVETSAANIVLYYVEVPINFLYKVKVSNITSLHLGGGPYIGYGISSNISVKNYIAPGINTELKFNYQNPDYGINGIVGIEIKNKYIVDAGYGLGLGNITNGPAVIKNRVISFSTGYMFR